MKNSKELVDIGIAWRGKGNYDKAIECYQKAINLDPYFTAAYINMGFAYGQKGNYEKEIESYKNAVRFGDTEAQDFLQKKNIKW